jgi:hypothetical protein
MRKIFWDGKQWVSIGKVSPDGVSASVANIVTPEAGDVVMSYFSTIGWRKGLTGVVGTLLTIVSCRITWDVRHSTYQLGEAAFVRWTKAVRSQEEQDHQREVDIALTMEASVVETLEKES